MSQIVGHISQVIGPVVDVYFDPGKSFAVNLYGALPPLTNP